MCSSSEPGKVLAGDVQSVNHPYYKWSMPRLICSGTASVGKNVRSQTEPEAPTLSLGERVVWLNDENPEFGIVRWIGRIPNICSDWTIGVEFDNPIGIGNGSFQGRQYFVTKPKHACFLPIIGLIKAEEFQAGCLKEKECYSQWKNSPGGKIWQKSDKSQCKQCDYNQSTKQKTVEESPRCHHCGYFMKDSQDLATTSSGPKNSDGGGWRIDGYEKHTGKQNRSRTPKSCLTDGLPINPHHRKSVTIKETVSSMSAFGQWADKTTFPDKTWQSNSHSFTSCLPVFVPGQVIYAQEISSDTSASDIEYKGSFRSLVSCFTLGNPSKKRKKKKKKLILTSEEKKVIDLTPEVLVTHNSNSNSKSIWKDSSECHKSFSGFEYAIKSTNSGLQKNASFSSVNTSNLSTSMSGGLHRRCASFDAAASHFDVEQFSKKKKKAPPPPPPPDPFILEERGRRKHESSSAYNLLSKQKVEKDIKFGVMMTAALRTSSSSTRRPSNKKPAPQPPISTIVSKSFDPTLDKSPVTSFGMSQSNIQGFSQGNHRTRLPRNENSVFRPIKEDSASPHFSSSINEKKWEFLKNSPGNVQTYSCRRNPENLSMKNQNISCFWSDTLLQKPEPIKPDTQNSVLELLNFTDRASDCSDNKTGICPALPKKTVPHDTLTLFGFSWENNKNLKLNEQQSKTPCEIEIVSQKPFEIYENKITACEKNPQSKKPLYENLVKSSMPSALDSAAKKRLSLVYPDFSATSDSMKTIENGIIEDKSTPSEEMVVKQDSKWNSVSVRTAVSVLKSNHTSASAAQIYSKNWDSLIHKNDICDLTNASCTSLSRTENPSHNLLPSTTGLVNNSSAINVENSVLFNCDKEKKHQISKLQKDCFAGQGEDTELEKEFEQILKSRPCVKDFVAAFNDLTQKYQVIDNISSLPRTEDNCRKEFGRCNSMSSAIEKEGKTGEIPMKSFPTKWKFTVLGCMDNSLDSKKSEDNVLCPLDTNRHEIVPESVNISEEQLFSCNKISEEKNEKNIKSDEINSFHEVPKMSKDQSNFYNTNPSALSSLHKSGSLAETRTSISFNISSKPPLLSSRAQQDKIVGKQDFASKTHHLSCNSSAKSALEENDKNIKFNSLTHSTFTGQKGRSYSPIVVGNSTTANIIKAKPKESSSVMEPEMTTKMECNDASVVQKSQVSSLFKLLEEAIASGEHKRAAALARELALRKVSCSLSKTREMKDKTCEHPITLNLFVEDKSSHRGPLPLRVLPGMTLKMLKKKVEAVFKFPVQVQRWILGKSLATNDGATLASYGIKTEGCPVFLYLVSLCSKDKEGQPQTILPETEVCPRIAHPKAGLCLLPGPSEYKAIDELPQMGFYTSDSDSDHPIVNHGNEEMADNESDKESNDSDTLEDKMCSNCARSGAEVKCKRCTSAGSEGITSAVKELVAEPEDDLGLSDHNEKIQDYHKLVELDEQDLVPNMDVFECPVCFMNIEKEKGVVLRDCLHLFCRDCLAGAIYHTEAATVKCLFRNEEYSCDSQLQDREIKALVSPEEYERFLQRSIATAENGADNSFHCKTPDCKGWCFYEDNVNAFLCPVCDQTNCLTCRAIHEGRNCRQYQDELEFEAAGSEEAKKTKEFLDSMLSQGDAMRCPKCQVIVMKRWGCDWLKCSVCQTEICWVTKGPRWGPGGKGDTSGGCGCGVNGIRCHPKCNYCH
ncbi:uncharacterized protein LOC143240327 isoform X2 [Tachypleus tridentatus]|uniref:uncharacterized protein LOC143240327 isoform X2 n=1 Tax=Tachypleus tridentatus TaxID=6853 RepID=UPI003FD5DBB7